MIYLSSFVRAIPRLTVFMLSAQHNFPPKIALFEKFHLMSIGHRVLFSLIFGDFYSAICTNYEALQPRFLEADYTYKTLFHCYNGFARRWRPSFVDDDGVPYQSTAQKAP